MGLFKTLGNNPFFNALRNIRAVLDLDQKHRGVIMFGLLLLNAIFDVLGLAAIYPLIDAALDPSQIQEKWYLKYAYDTIGATDTLWFLFILALIVFTIFLVKNGLSLLIYYIQAKFAFNISQRLSLKMFQHYYKQGFLYINNEDSGTKAYNIINVPYIFANTYLMQSLILATELMVLLIIFLGVLWFNPSAIFVLMVVIIPTFIFVYQLTKMKVKSLGDQRNQLYPKTYANVLDAMNAYPDVKLANKEQLFLEFYGSIQKRINQIDALRTGVYGKIHQRMNDIVLGLGLLVVFGFALIFRENSAEIIAILSVFGLAAYRFLPSVNRIMQAALSLKNTSYLVERLNVIQNQRLVPFPEVPVWDFKSSIRFDKVGYSYPESKQKVLSNLSFEIKKGETVGFIGSSGSGKTTLLNLLLRFLQETEGTVYVDGQALNRNNEASFQCAVGYVQQNIYIKNGTLAENIAFGEPLNAIDLTKLHKAIEDAMLTDFVKQSPKGVHTQLGENGTKLSGGQKQRVGIARALYKNAQILVFDEATSALDTETEKSIVLTLNHLTSLNKTIFIVAHRITTLEMCDRIFELKEGRIKRILQYAEIFKEKLVETE